MTLDPPTMDELVERVALRVVELLDERPMTAPRVVDPAGLAQILGVSRGTIYEHAKSLGAIRIGNGPKAAMRFDVEKAMTAWTARCAGSSSQEPATPATAPRRAGRPRRTPGTGVELLPIRGQVAA